MSHLRHVVCPMHPALQTLQSLKSTLPEAGRQALLLRQFARPVRSPQGSQEPAPYLWEEQWADVLQKSLPRSIMHQVYTNGDTSPWGWGSLDGSFYGLHAVAGALLTWDQTRFIFRMDPHMADMLEATEGLSEVPIEKFRRLPAPSVFVEGEFEVLDIDGKMRQGSGFWATVQESQAGQVKMRLVPLLARLSEQDEWESLSPNPRLGSIELGVFSVPITGFGEGDQITSITDKIEHMHKGLNNDLPQRVIDSHTAWIRRSLNQLMYLTSSQPELTEAAAPPPAKRKANQPPPKPVRLWDVGLREGAVWRQAKEAQAAYDAAHPGETERSMRPHWRAAHWHGYWTGPRDSEERGLVIKWIAPVLVQARLAVEAGQDLPAVRRRVRRSP